MNPIKEWVEHHLPNKNDEDLWYLAAEVLTELSKESTRFAMLNGPASTLDNI